LIQSGANVNQADKDGKTPLMIAKEKNHDEIVKFLENPIILAF
jgi:ankyrin repeat protein